MKENSLGSGIRYEIRQYWHSSRWVNSSSRSALPPSSERIEIRAPPPLVEAGFERIAQSLTGTAPDDDSIDQHASPCEIRGRQAVLNLEHLQAPLLFQHQPMESLFHQLAGQFR